MLSAGTTAFYCCCKQRYCIDLLRITSQLCVCLCSGAEVCGHRPTFSSLTWQSQTCWCVLLRHPSSSLTACTSDGSLERKVTNAFNIWHLSFWNTVQSYKYECYDLPCTHKSTHLLYLWSHWIYTRNMYWFRTLLCDAQFNWDSAHKPAILFHPFGQHLKVPLITKPARMHVACMFYECIWRMLYQWCIIQYIGMQPRGNGDEEVVTAAQRSTDQTLMERSVFLQLSWPSPLSDLQLNSQWLLLKDNSFLFFFKPTSLQPWNPFSSAYSLKKIHRQWDVDVKRVTVITFLAS